MFEFRAVVLGEFGGELTAAFVAVEMYRPIFLRFKRADFVFALTNQTQSRALYAACAQTAADFFPQQWREVETDQIVQSATGLLRIDQIHFDFARMGNRIEHGVFGDFVEHDTLRLDVFQAAFGFEDFQKMPRNGFAFPIRVGCEVDVFSFFGTGNDGIDVFAVAADQLVFHGKAIVGIDCSAFRNQIADVAVRRQDFKITAQIFFQGFGFGRGFDD